MNPERERILRTAAAAGRKLRDIAQELGVTRQNVQQQYKRLGLSQERKAIRRSSKLRGPKPDRMCGWCPTLFVVGPRTVYCSTACRRAAHNQQHKEHYRTDPVKRAKYRAKKAEWQRNNRERANATLRRWYAKRRQREDGR